MKRLIISVNTICGKSKGEHTMSVADEIREEQKKALSAMSFKEKLAYFWDYYKVHTIITIIVLACAISFIRQYMANKDYGFYAALVNAHLADSSSELSAVWAEEFQEYAQIDPDEYLVYIDTSISLSEGLDAQYALTNQEKMLAMLQAGIVNAVVGDTEVFERYARNEYFYDLESLLSSEELEKFSSYFYYTDAAAFADAGDDTYYDADARANPADLVIDHRDPSSMEQPVAVGIILTRDNMIADAGFYSYLEEANTLYQGYPSEVVMGIPVTNKEPELALRFLEYIKLGN